MLDVYVLILLTIHKHKQIPRFFCEDCACASSWYQAVILLLLGLGTRLDLHYLRMDITTTFTGAAKTLW